MRLPRLRLLRPRSTKRPPPPPGRTTITIDALALHRVARTAIRDLQDRVEVLENLVGLLDSIAGEVYTGDPAEEIRAATTMLRCGLREVVATAVDASVAVGQVRLVGALRSIEIEDGPPE